MIHLTLKYNGETVTIEKPGETTPAEIYNALLKALEVANHKKQTHEN